MRLLIIEDEYHAVKWLSSLIGELLPEATIVATLDSVEDSVKWLNQHPLPDLMFMDIQLADGLSFDIFPQVPALNCPIIFTTAYDAYTLQAFKVNSVDYLLKPVSKEELQAALDQFFQLNGSANPNAQLEALIKSLTVPKGYKQRFLLKQGQSWYYVAANEIAFFYAEDGLTFLMDKQGKRHIVESTMEELYGQLDPGIFFRINRGQIVHLQSIQKINSFFNHRLKLQLQPASDMEHIVARNKVKDFKGWLDR